MSKAQAGGRGPGAPGGLTRRRGLRAALALAAPLALAAAGCGAEGTGAPAGSAGGAAAPAAGTGGAGAAGPRRLKIGVSFQVASLSPEDQGFWLTSYGTGQSLYRVTPDEKLMPWIASSITADGQDGYTIKLDPKARFHNGKPILAAAVQGCLERYVDGGVPERALAQGRALPVARSPDAPDQDLRA